MSKPTSGSRAVRPGAATADPAATEPTAGAGAAETAATAAEPAGRPVELSYEEMARLRARLVRKFH